MSNSDEPYRFKFHWLDENGNQKGMFRKKGQLDGEVLTLEETEIPIPAILQAQTVENRMLLTVPTGAEEYASLLFMPSSKSITDELKKRIDIGRSRTWAVHHKEQLTSAGRGNAYRDAVCPACTATLVLSDMPVTPQVYCHFCDSLSTIDQSPPQGEAKLGLCDECGMYSQPIRYSVFYFVFLLVVYWFKHGKAKKCRACMRSDAWKMLFGNLIFVLGVPNAIYQLIRSYSGGSIIEGVYAGLNSANIAARKANWGKATAGYRKVLESAGVSAGVKYNLGLALENAGSPDQAARSFELALDDCANYAPAYSHLVTLYNQLGEKEKLRELNSQWIDGAADGEDGAEPDEFAV